MKIEPGKINSTITLPTSKSISNRFLILAALEKKDVTIENISGSEDVTFLINALSMIGLIVENNNESLVIKNSFPECETTDHFIDIGEGGTTLHFLMALLVLGKKKYTIKLNPGLALRPHQQLIKALNDLGAFCIQDDDLIIIQGPITRDYVNIDSDLSSQYASSLALIKKRGKFELKVSKLKSSESFYNLTLKTIKLFDLKNTVPVDMTSLSYPFCFALLNQEIMVTNCFDIDFNQPDSELYKYFPNNIIMTEKGLKILPLSSLNALSFDMNNSLDIIPTLSFLVSYLSGESKISGIKNLVYKESNRLLEIKNLLNIFKIEYREENDNLYIKGGNTIDYKVNIDSPFDHRMVMTGFLFLKHNQGGSLTSVSSVNKSFPGFFSLLQP